MQKKVFLQKNLRSGGSGGAYLKYLMLAAVGLILLVIVTPYLFKDKSKEIQKRPVPDKTQVVKELPKPEPAPAANVQEAARPAEPSRPPEPARPLEMPKPPETAQAPQRSVEPPVPVAQRTVTETTVAPPPDKTASQPAPQDLFPKKPSAPIEAPAAAVAPKPAPPQTKEEKAGKVKSAAVKPPAPGPAPAKTIAPAPAKTIGPAEAAPKAVGAPASAAGKRYAVQVGTFKERSEAEVVQRNLTKKGYSVVVVPSAPSAGGALSYRVVTTPVESASKAATMMEQMRSEGRTTPSLITMPQGGAAAAAKPPAKKPAAKAPAAQPVKTTP